MVGLPFLSPPLVLPSAVVQYDLAQAVGAERQSLKVLGLEAIRVPNRPQLEHANGSATGYMQTGQLPRKPIKRPRLGSALVGLITLVTAAASARRVTSKGSGSDNATCRLKPSVRGTAAIAATTGQSQRELCARRRRVGHQQPDRAVATTTVEVTLRACSLFLSALSLEPELDPSNYIVFCLRAQMPYRKSICLRTATPSDYRFARGRSDRRWGCPRRFTRGRSDRNVAVQFLSTSKDFTITRQPQLKLHVN